MSPLNRRTQRGSTLPRNPPWLTLGVLALLLASGVVITISGHADDSGGENLITLVVAAVPSLLAAAYAERTSRDMRNGVVTEKVRDATESVLDERGVTAGRLTSHTVEARLSEDDVAALRRIIEREVNRGQDDTQD